MKIIAGLVSFFVLGSFVTVMSPLGKSESQAIEEESSFGEHVELGDVHWLRNFERGKARAGSTGKPMFLLFQEIPGCQTCRDYGNNPLSHPLVVEAIEELFVPVAVFNNREGTDAEILKRFQEPSWNNPVVRFLDTDASDIIQRQDGVWSVAGTVDRMVQALNSAGKEVPDYLPLIQPSPADIETAEFAMYCYWEGESRLGSLDGVLSTRSGWRDGLEVVQVTFSPSRISYKKLLESAQSLDCASKVFAHTDEQLDIARAAVGDQAARASGAMRDAKASDQKYYLSHSLYRHLPLTPTQATKINAVVKQQKSPEKLLSPRQRQMMELIGSAAKTDKYALSGFTFPDDPNQLADYYKKLTVRLRDLNSSN